MTKMITYTATLVALSGLELHPANVRSAAAGIAKLMWGA